VYVYGNLLHGSKWAGLITDTDEIFSGIYVFSNVIYSEGDGGINLSGLAGSTTWVFNNTMAENVVANESPEDGAIAIIGNGTFVVAKNNIFYKTKPNISTYRQNYVHANMDEKSTFDHNIYYWPGHTSQTHWGDIGWTDLSGLQSGSIHGLPQEVNGSEGDPGLVDLDDNDYRIAAADSAVIGNGVDMGSGAIATLTIQGHSYPVPWDFALGPNTDWSPTIAVIDKLSRDTIGWDQGAYGYRGQTAPDGQDGSGSDGGGPGDGLRSDGDGSRPADVTGGCGCQAGQLPLVSMAVLFFAKRRRRAERTPREPVINS
ncbi:hypothetical protein ACFL6C_14625, partial [Myxococcota bacterium]